jgi:hypothetical protein
MIRAFSTVTMSKQRRISSGWVICATWRPMKATSSMSAVPSEYHGSSTQSWPQPTVMPWACISFTRVRPRRLG